MAALEWILQDGHRAGRYLDLTGLDPETLKSTIGNSETLAASLEFLTCYEPDLIRAAEALAVTPEDLVEAYQELSI